MDCDIFVNTFMRKNCFTEENGCYGEYLSLLETDSMSSYLEQSGGEISVRADDNSIVLNELDEHDNY